MLSDTLTTGLERYRIGPKIRSLRAKQKLSLLQLSDQTAISSGMLSKIERGQLFPTLPTLLKIAMVFGIGLDHFFVESEPRPTLAVVRKKDRLRLPDRPGAESPRYYFESLDFPVNDRKIETYYAEFEKNAEATDPHSHSGAEVVYVLKGQLGLIFDEDETILSAGDSVYFDSGYPHSYRGQGATFCSVIVVVSR